MASGGSAQEAWARFCARAMDFWQEASTSARARAGTVKSEVVRLSGQLADICVERSKHLGGLAVQGSQKALEAAKSGTRKAAGLTAEACRDGYHEAIVMAQRAAKEICESPSLRLQEPGSSEAIATTLARWEIDIFGFADELRRLPTPMALAFGCLALRVATAAQSLVDDISCTLLYQRTLVSRLSLLGVAAIGPCALRHYSGLLCEEQNVSGRDLRERCSQLAANSARLPAAFWLALTLSGTLAVQAGKDALAKLLRRSLALRIRTIILSLVASIVVARGKPAIQELLVRLTSQARTGMSRLRKLQAPRPDTGSESVVPPDQKQACVSMMPDGNSSIGGSSTTVGSLADAADAVPPTFRGVS
mmetsp:Transcript_32234/g.75715  ORF Transcript_32234/g.75715 Transcript_32234/m.75715 type:complete len:363 (+) Transcript_32234:86-1174(+)